MDQAEAAAVRAELVALQAVLMAMFRRMAQERTELAPIFCRAFDEAEAILTGVAMKMGLEDPSGSAVGALGIIEEMRRGVISDEQWCSAAAKPEAKEP